MLLGNAGLCEMIRVQTRCVREAVFPSYVAKWSRVWTLRVVCSLALFHSGWGRGSSVRNYWVAIYIYQTREMVSTRQVGYRRLRIRKGIA